MRAALLEHLPAEKLAIADVKDPKPSPHELLVRVEACGICGTDIHILAGHSYRPPLPFVIGHEPVGVVVAAGAETLKDWIGRRITMTIFEGCGHCAYCQAGDERLCLDPRSALGVLNRWGGFAEMMTIPAAQVVDIPAGLDSVHAATLVDAGVTAANAVAKLPKTIGSVVVVGMGPVGFFVGALLRHANVEPTVIETNALRATEARKQGFQVLQNADAVEFRPDAVLDCTGVAAVLPWALRVLRPRGLFMVVGYSVVPEVDIAFVSRKELIIQGVRSGSRSNLQQVVALAAEGSIKLPAVQTWRLDGINEALAELRAGSVAGKAVVVP